MSRYTPLPVFGSHLSIAGSMVNALREAEALGMDTVQVFTKNQQQWSAKPLDSGMVAEWKSELSRLGWAPTAGTPGRVVSHASYLINLASVNDELWRKSVDLMRDEIERCETLGIPYLVHHPGSFVGWDLESGLARIAKAYAELFKSTAGYRTVSCLEGTVGAGSTIGGPFEQLAALRRMIVEAAGVPARVGFCLDTCHMHAFGYDLSTRASAEAVMDEFARVCGPGHLRVLHVNDSKGERASRLDRHAHIGEGTVGRGTTPKALRESGFAGVLNRPEARDIPKILETPKGTNPDGTNCDTVNLRRLRALLDDEGPSRTVASVETHGLRATPGATARPAPSREKITPAPSRKGTGGAKAKSVRASGRTSGRGTKKRTGKKPR